MGEYVVAGIGTGDEGPWKGELEGLLEGIAVTIGGGGRHDEALIAGRECGGPVLYPRRHRECFRGESARGEGVKYECGIELYRHARVGRDIVGKGTELQVRRGEIQIGVRLHLGRNGPVVPCIGEGRVHKGAEIHHRPYGADADLGVVDARGARAVNENVLLCGLNARARALESEGTHVTEGAEAADEAKGGAGELVAEDEPVAGCIARIHIVIAAEISLGERREVLKRGVRRARHDHAEVAARARGRVEQARHGAEEHASADVVRLCEVVHCALKGEAADVARGSEADDGGARLCIQTDGGAEETRCSEWSRGRSPYSGYWT